MPNRILRDAILSSERMALLGWPEEVFYRRLMSIVDDYGRFEANPQLLRSRCYPLQTDAVRVADISRWMAACQKAGLILFYAAGGKQYLELRNFQQQQRSASKYPAPLANDINCEQVLANAHLDVGVVVCEDVVVKKATVQQAALPEGFDAFWSVYPIHRAKADAVKAWRQVSPVPLPTILAKLPIQIAQDDSWLRGYVPLPGTYLRGSRWLDDIAKPTVNGSIPSTPPKPGIHKFAEETPLERSLAWLRQQERLGAITPEQHKQQATDARTRHTQ